MTIEQHEDLSTRLKQIELMLQLLVEQHVAKEWYTTAEVAEIVGRSDYTVREWCRKSQVEAEKSANGRGWLISNQNLTRIRNGELPVPEHERPKAQNGRG